MSSGASPSLRVCEVTRTVPSTVVILRTATLGLGATALSSGPAI